MNPGHMVRMGMSAAQVSLTGARIPINVMLSVTNRCNARCSYCDIPARQQQELTDAEIHTLIDDMADCGTRRLGIWGGEPLLREAIGDFITHAHERNIYTTLDTNGYLLEQRLPRLKHLEHILFSLDGEAPYHDKNREPGSHEKTLRGIQKAIEAGMNVWTITVLTCNNLHSIDYILDQAEALGFKATFQVLHHSAEMSQHGMDLLPADQAYREAIQRLIDAKEAGRPVGSSSFYLEHVKTWPDFRLPRADAPHRGLNCLAGQAVCNVDTDGTVYPCSLLIGHYPGLNIREGGFKAAFDATRHVPCKSCVAACFTEYSKIFALHLRTIAEWTVAMADAGPFASRLMTRATQASTRFLNMELV